MTELSPELEKFYAEGRALMREVAPILQGSHSFVMMMVLSNLIAQWLLAHPEDQRDKLVVALAATVEDNIDILLRPHRRH
jgi:hypothetical protein